jgi:hypothetical protein
LVNSQKNNFALAKKFLLLMFEAFFTGCQTTTGLHLALVWKVKAMEPCLDERLRVRVSSPVIATFIEHNHICLLSMFETNFNFVIGSSFNL